MDGDRQLKRLRYRAWHRGTREADMLVGGFFDARHRCWSKADRDWFAALLDEQDVDIIAWAFGKAEPPDRLAGPMMEALRRLDYVRLAR